MPVTQSPERLVIVSDSRSTCKHMMVIGTFVIMLMYRFCSGSGCLTNLSLSHPEHQPLVQGFPTGDE